MAGTLFVVATPIGNLDDISARALRVLASVRLIAAEDTRHTAHLLQRYALTTPLTSLHEHNEAAKSDALIARLQEGDDVALVSDAGTPGIADPGRHLVRRAHDAGIRVEPVPGPSAIVAALSASGLSADSFAFLGFPPTKGSHRRAWMASIRALAGLVQAVVFYEAPHRIQATLSELAAAFPDAEVLVARELTKIHEQLRLAPLKTFAAETGRGEYTVVMSLGHVTDMLQRVPLPEAADIATEFGEMTEDRQLTRRQGIASLSRKYGLPARRIFDLIEEGRKSGS